MANSDLDLSEYNGAPLVGAAITFLALSWVSVLLRGYVRLFITRRFQADDYLMVVGQIIFTLSCVFILLGDSEGLGRHNAALTQDVEIASLMWQALATATYIIDMMFIKLSIGIFLLRLAVRNLYRYILWGTLVIVTIWSTVLFFWDVFQCKPVAAQWDYTIENGRCVSPGEVVAGAYSLSVMSILSDWLFALLPIPMLWDVAMTKQTKITVIVILGLGIFASIATLIRLKFLADLGDTTDILFDGTDAMVWTLVEPGVAIVAASLATIRPLLRFMRIRGFGSTARAGGKSTGLSRSGGTKSVLDQQGSSAGAVESQVGAGAIDMELGTIHETAGEPRTKVGRHRENYNFSRPHGAQAAAVGAKGRRGDIVKSEMYVVEGPRTGGRGDRPLGGTFLDVTHCAGGSSTSDCSSETGLDAHSQESDRGVVRPKEW